MQLLILKQDRGAQSKGDIIEVRASGTPFGGAEPAIFVLAEVPGVPMTAFEHYNHAWARSVAFDIVASDPAQDGFRLRLSADNANGVGILTRDEVEQYINSWGGTVRSVAINEVVFDIRIYDALTSPAFWEIDAGLVRFTEQSYDPAIGIHRIEADYSALANNPTYVERYVRDRGVDIVSHADRVIVYDAARVMARGGFEADLREKLKKIIARRRYYVSEAVVEAIVSQGGYVQVDLPTLDSYIRDKMIE